MSNSSAQSYQIAIVGGGAVGLFLGIALEQAGLSSIILEKRTKPHPGSRSLGIHPVSLELFQKMGIAKQFVEAGIHISEGHAFTNNRKLGTLSFEDCPRPYNFILSLPQYKTESILEHELNKLNNNLLVRGAEVTDIIQKKNEVKVSFETGNITNTIRAKYVVGCDGKNSFVRNNADIPFEGKTYPDTYIMGDFTDNTQLGSDAAIFLCEEGLIESFPLLNQQRRWVVKTEGYIASVQRKDIETRILGRINHDIYGTEHMMLSSFGVQKLLARSMMKQHILLVGDAAHVVSPIGGQGMNLGWLGAWDLAHSMDIILNENQPAKKVLDSFQKRRKKAARNAIRRAELNMHLGRKSRFPRLRNTLVSLLVHDPISILMARIFTMRGVERWLI